MAGPTTPEPPSPNILRVPGAPRWGPLYDDYEPFEPRKSARVAERAQRVVEGTPPPAERSSTAKKHSSIASPPATVKKDRFTNPTDLISPPPTGKATSRRKIVGGFNLRGSRVTTDYEGKGKDRDNDTIMAGTETMSRNGMLATPAETPTSKKTVIEASSIKSVARNLFSYTRPATIDEVMPSPKKKGRKKLNVFEISSDAEEDTPIEIYTDSKDRIPEVDDAEDNPFYDNPDKPAKSKQSPRTTKRRKAGRSDLADHTYGPESMGTNGAVFVFRGKKFWRSFEEKDPGGTEVEQQLERETLAMSEAMSGPPIHTCKPAPFKGAWLFGEHPRKTQANEEEDTDVEEKVHKKAGGGAKPTLDKTAPVKSNAPPPTTRVTRAQKVSRGHGQDAAGVDIADDEHTLRGGPRGRSRGGNTSPFDHWTRTRSPMEDMSSRGSPVRGKKVHRPTRGMGTRSRGAASTAHV